MELTEFISTTLVHISEGVSAANNHTIKNSLGSFYIPGDDGTEGHANKSIEFDIAVLAGEGKEENIKGDVSAKVYVVGAGVHGEQKDTNYKEAVSRVKFTVRVGHQIGLRGKGNTVRQMS